MKRNLPTTLSFTPQRYPYPHNDNWSGRRTHSIVARTAVACSAHWGSPFQRWRCSHEILFLNSVARKTRWAKAASFGLGACKYRSGIAFWLVTSAVFLFLSLIVLLPGVP